MGIKCTQHRTRQHVSATGALKTKTRVSEERKNQKRSQVATAT